jgi:hypothetical protein
MIMDTSLYETVVDENERVREPGSLTLPNTFQIG